MDRKEWLRSAVFYEIYPTSFYDSDGDGVGDIKGMISKLDYVAGLGCNGIWLNPLFLSPFRDGGYDVADYRRVDPRFGTNEDLARMFTEAAKRGIKVLMDLVPGHTSDTHPYFTASCKAERNAYSDTYIWTDTVWDDTDGMRAVSGTVPRDGSYIVNFFSMQPALNYGFAEQHRPWQKHWQDPAVAPQRQELLDVVKFWLKLGAGGFRVDMAWSLVKNDPDGSANCALWDGLLGEVREEFPEAVFVSEWSTPERAVGKAGFDMDFLLHFGQDAYNSLLRAEECYFKSGSATTLAPFFTYFQEVLPKLNGRGFIAIPTGNHDMVRVSEGKSADELAAAYCFLMTLPSVPFVYYGDELGMRYQRIPNKDGGYDRTGSRTPMQWAPSKNLGFSDSDAPYLPADTREDLTVQAQAGKDSLLERTRALIGLKRSEPALAADAELRLVSAPEDVPFLYERVSGRERIAVYLNAKSAQCEAALRFKGKILLAHNAEVREKAVRFTGPGFLIVKAAGK